MMLCVWGRVKRAGGDGEERGASVVLEAIQIVLENGLSTLC